MTWSHEVTLQDGTATITGGAVGEPPEYTREYAQWDRIASGKRTQLETAVKTAPLMVDAAIAALGDYCRRCDQTGKDDAALANEEAWIGLAKYFCLTGADTDTYWDRVLGILSAFYKIARGMTAPANSRDAYVVHLTFFQGRNARVTAGVTLGGEERSGVSPIRATFGFQDEWGHSPCLWRLPEGPIQLNTPFIVLPPKGEESNKAHELARIIVHEGSHKWAQTKDVMYKYAGTGTKINAFYGEWAKKVGKYAFTQKMKAMTKEPRPQGTLPSDGEVLQRMMESYERQEYEETKERQQSVAVQVPGLQRDKKQRSGLGGVKPLIKMAGLPMEANGVRSGTGPVQDEQWLENADSYAWFARRMWKRARNGR
jgi:hypothetical protein